VDEFLNKNAGGGEHGNATVLELGLAQPLDIPKAGEAERIEANVARQCAIQILRTRKEGD
jgi:hypothetical protein